MVARFSAGPAADRLNGVAIGTPSASRDGSRQTFSRCSMRYVHLDGEPRRPVRCSVAATGRRRPPVCVLSLYAPEMFTELQPHRLEIITPHLATALAAADRERTRTGGSSRIVAPVTRFKRSRERVPGVREPALAVSAPCAACYPLRILWLALSPAASAQSLFI